VLKISLSCTFSGVCAGYDTTANTLSFACFCLATNPEIQDKVFEEIDTVLTEVSA
jgi:cytochrome P450